jgi:outer membrane protein assembly factor BamA
MEGVSGFSLVGGAPLFFPVRGYGEAARFGRRAWTASLEYRFPLALVNRGLGAWPLHLDRVTGALFADAGNAWGPELGIQGYQNPKREALASVGGEVAAEGLALWAAPLLLRGGVGVPLRGGRDPAVYVRLGLSF